MMYDGHYWSGYYTSRPNFKKLIRDTGYQAFLSLTQYSQMVMEDLTNQYELGNLTQALQQELALLMHHDTITGTSKSYVI